MVAPKGPGHLVSTYLEGGGVPSLIAIHQDSSGQAKQALAYASANGGGRVEIIEPALRKKLKPIFLANNQFYGGVTALIRWVRDLVAGYAPEMAYFECLHEVKLIVDLIYEGGIADMLFDLKYSRIR